MTPDTTLTLGTFQFQGLEIPAEIQGVGAQQRLAVHKFPGGARIIDAMGVDYSPLSWSGLFFGSGSLSRLATLKTLAAAGQPLSLTWHTFNYTVLIRDFGSVERRQFEISYNISCEVLSDNSNPVTTSTTLTSTAAITADGLSASAIAADLVADSATATTAAAYEALQNQIEDTVSQITALVGLIIDLVYAVPSQIASIVQSLAIAQNQVTSLISGCESTIGAQPGFAGLVVGVDALTLALNFASVESAMLAEIELWNLDGLLGRMAANLNALNESPNTLTVAGGNLFEIAANEYGDVEDWTAIATANGLTDPFITGPVTLTIPLAPADNGGILSS
jgi:hypothetical protein